MANQERNKILSVSRMKDADPVAAGKPRSSYKVGAWVNKSTGNTAGAAAAAAPAEGAKQRQQQPPAAKTTTGEGVGEKISSKEDILAAARAEADAAMSAAQKVRMRAAMLGCDDGWVGLGLGSTYRTWHCSFEVKTRGG